MNFRSSTAVRPKLPPWLAVLLLGVFLAARGLVPAGFMPSAVSSGAPYQLCHGDSRSALLLNLSTPAHREHAHGGHASGHGDHQHDSATAQVFSDNHCNFSSASVSIAARVELHWSPLPGFIAPAPTAPETLSLRDEYLYPPGRAPPTASVLA